MTDTETTQGQAIADSAGTTATAPEGVTGTSVGTTQTTLAGPDSAMESFFDPSSIQDKPELLSAYKQMQGQFTKRMQGMREHQTKIEAYDRFTQDPVTAMQQLAAQYGYNLVQRTTSQPKDFNPESWDDVIAEAKKAVRKEFEPVFGELRQLKQQSVQQQLDKDFPDWRTYEDDMIQSLQKHPSLAQDPAALYRLSVPQEVWEAKATKIAMAKLRAASDHGQISGGTTTTRQIDQTPTGPLTFDQAVELAKARLAKKRA